MNVLFKCGHAYFITDLECSLKSVHPLEKLANSEHSKHFAPQKKKFCHFANTL